VSVRARAKEILGESGEFPEDGYRGEYIRELAQRYLDEVGHDLSDIDAIRHFAVRELRKEQDRDLAAFGVRFDNYYLESSLYTDGRVDATVARLVASGPHLRERRRAVAAHDRLRRRQGPRDAQVRRRLHVLRARRRVPRHQVGARLPARRQRAGLRPPQHGHARARGAAGARRGHPAGYPDYVLHKMVTVMRGGEEVKISKRAGDYVTLRDLIDEVGRDAVRYFLVARKADSEFVFDIDLALSQSEENPVYYVQYAHARVASVLRQAGILRDEAPARLAHADLAPLAGSHEQALLNRLADFPDEVAAAARDFAPHQLTAYLKALAGAFHGYYNAERFLVDDAKVRDARLALVVATGEVLRNGLALLGIGAPDEM
jgi:arginyl-tRNA synthetase